ncbi:MAG: hypothetical protein ACHQNV_05405 [Vicinamibacteria bacterium]
MPLTSWFGVRRKILFKCLGPILAFASLALSLLVRVSLRGDDYAGWDLLGPAYGLYMLSTLPFFTALRQLAHAVVDFGFWNHTNSLLFTFIPGVLTQLWPWEYWGHLVNFVLVVATFRVIQKVARLPGDQTWLLALAWASSPALLSFAVSGYPYATGFLPHALALLVVTRPRLQERPLATLLACLGILALSWNVYESGKTFFVVLVLASILERSAPSRVRAVWIFVALLQVAFISVDRGRNVALVVSHLSPTGPLRTAGHLLPRFLGTHLDLPILVPLGVLALLVSGRYRALVTGCLAFQVAAVVLLADMSGGDLFPRRYLTITYYAIVAVAVAWTHVLPASRLPFRKIVLAGLVAGNVWQWADLALFFQTPAAERVEPLPFTQAPDYSVFPHEVDFVRTVRAEIDAGREVVLLHNLSADHEDRGNPAGVLERLYLGLGHEGFERSILVFGSRHGRYSRLPIRPLDAIRDDLRDLARGGPERLANVRVCFLRSEDSPRLLDENALVFAELRRRFSIQAETGVSSEVGCFGVARRPPHSLDEPPSVAGPADGVRSEVAWVGKVVADAPHLKASPGRAFEASWPGTITCARPGTYTLLLGVDGEARIFVAGRPTLAHASHGFALARATVSLNAGPNAVEVFFDSPTGLGRLVWDVQP